MKASRALPGLPLPTVHALKKLGRDVSSARRRRRITMALLAERAFVSRSTLARVERGDASVSMGVYASVLFTLGVADRLASLIDPATDIVGLALDDERLPKRVRMPRALGEKRTP